jgi:hypothetical protein
MVRCVLEMMCGGRAWKAWLRGPMGNGYYGKGYSIILQQRFFSPHRHRLLTVIHTGLQKLAWKGLSPSRVGSIVYSTWYRVLGLGLEGCRYSGSYARGTMESGGREGYDSQDSGGGGGRERMPHPIVGRAANELSSSDLDLA